MEHEDVLGLSLNITLPHCTLFMHFTNNAFIAFTGKTRTLFAILFSVGRIMFILSILCSSVLGFFSSKLVVLSQLANRASGKQQYTPQQFSMAVQLQRIPTSAVRKLHAQHTPVYILLLEQGPDTRNLDPDLLTPFPRHQYAICTHMRGAAWILFVQTPFFTAPIVFFCLGTVQRHSHAHCHSHVQYIHSWNASRHNRQKKRNSLDCCCLQSLPHWRWAKSIAS